MEPVTMAMLASAVPAVLSMFGSRGRSPAGPDYSQIMAYLNSPEMVGYRNQLMDTAFNPNNELFDTAMSRSMASGNRLAASRGLGTSSAGLGFVQGAQNDLANKFAENEFQRRLQAYGAVTNAAQSQAGIGINMLNQQHQDNMGRWNNENDFEAGLVGSIGGMARAGLSAYGEASRARELESMMSGYGARTPGYAGMVGGQPISSGGYNYGTYPTR